MRINDVLNGLPYLKMSSTNISKTAFRKPAFQATGLHLFKITNQGIVPYFGGQLNFTNLKIIIYRIKPCKIFLNSREQLLIV